MTELSSMLFEKAQEEKHPDSEWTWPRDRESQEREKALREEIQRLNQTIESIKIQYEELMDVARQYREEAIKWYNKFLTSR